MKNHFKILCGAVALAMAGQVSAATEWTLASNYGPISSGVTVSAYSNTGGNNTAANAANNAALQTIQAATWNNSWGGIYNADNCSSGSYCDSDETISPEHSIDNNQRYDMALLSFSSAVKLTNVKLGWASGDSDITVMAYTSNTPFEIGTNLTGKTYDQLVGAGWTAVGNYADVGTASPVTVNAGNHVSSYWLIGAYNPLAGGVSGGSSPWSVGNDNVKLASVTGEPGNRVPEPGSLALFGIALLGMLTLRKRQQA